MVANYTMRQGLRLSVPETDVAEDAHDLEGPADDARAEVAVGAGDETGSGLNHTKYYGDLTSMLERLHRRYLDVVRLGLESIGVNDINASQALILLNVGDGEVPIRDLVQRGYYLASSASYNIKKLVDYGYLEQARNQHDRRSVRLRLGEDGKKVVDRLKDLDIRLVDMAAAEPELLDQLDQATKTLRKLERVWAEFINFG
jgi:DNA-binding MarR family transcriptional regulator